MRASADELSAWEALTVTLAVHVDKISLRDEHCADLYRACFTGMCAMVGSMPVPILARNACIIWKKIMPPFRRSSESVVWRF
jgi:hypothetical protein